MQTVAHSFEQVKTSLETLNWNQPGKSAYQLAVDGGFTGTQAEWVAQVAYLAAVQSGFVGTLAQWVASLKSTTAGAPGALTKLFTLPQSSLTSVASGGTGEGVIVGGDPLKTVFSLDVTGAFVAGDGLILKLWATKPNTTDSLALSVRLGTAGTTADQLIVSSTITALTTVDLEVEWKAFGLTNLIGTGIRTNTTYGAPAAFTSPDLSVAGLKLTLFASATGTATTNIRDVRVSRYR